MTTTTTSIERLLDNAFMIKRKGTKHRDEFAYNTFERPVTHLDFFQLLANSDINLPSAELAKYMCYIKATDYCTNWRGDVKLVVGSSFAQIVVKGAEWLNIWLNRSKLISMVPWFQDQSLFHTDFGLLTKNTNYYR